MFLAAVLSVSISMMILLIVTVLILVIVIFRKRSQEGIYNTNLQAVTESPKARLVSPERETTPHETDETNDPTRSAGECTLGDHEVTLEPSDVNNSFIQSVQLF